MIDTHAHLDACDEPAGTLVARARAVGVTRIITVGTGIESCRAALATAAQEPGVFCALGIHPHQAGEAEAKRLDELRELLADDRAVAVGETGLDFYRDWAPHDAQRRLFADQLALASDLDLPVVIHCRSAEMEVMSELSTFAGTVVLHCFSSPELLPAALERDYYVSFAGNVTYPKADRSARCCCRRSGRRASSLRRTAPILHLSAGADVPTSQRTSWTLLPRWQPREASRSRSWRGASTPTRP